MTNDYKSNEQRWQAVERRIQSADGTFFYGVLTTGVYCKPSCASRLPLRKNVVFYSTPNEAERAGLRPCKRCNPKALDHASLDRALHHLARTIMGNAEESFTLESVSKELNISAGHLQKRFKSVFGLTLKEFHVACRTQVFLQAIRDGLTVTDAIFAAGYGSTSRLYENSNTNLGATPKQLASKGEGVSLSYGFMQTPLGLMLLAATDRGICFLQFGDSERELLNNLNGTFSFATKTECALKQRPEFKRWQSALCAYMEGKMSTLSLPVDLRGTVFQQLVWKYLQTIPSGEVRSYKDVAQAIGKPTAARAVGTACGANPVAVLVPCHRVLRGNGALADYRWGVERKRKLLELEAVSGKGRVIGTEEER